MKILLLTDTPKHNLALMKISTYHKSKGNEVFLNMPIWKSDYSYASWVFQNKHRFEAHEIGGIAVDPQIELPDYIERLRPDYRLFNLKHSLGYTFRACFRFRQCPFCKVPLLPVRIKHHSIWEFHSKDFDTIELLNNNTFFDPHWEETFKEIYKAKLKVIENGMDLRLLDDKKAWWIKRLKWKNQPKFAWDRMKDEKKITEGMRILKNQGVKKATVYVLMGFDTSFEEDLHRCEVIYSLGYDPWPMLYNPTPHLRRFRRFIYLRYYKQYKTISKAWQEYKKLPRR